MSQRIQTILRQYLFHCLCDRAGPLAKMANHNRGNFRAAVSRSHRSHRIVAEA